MRNTRKPKQNWSKNLAEFGVKFRIYKRAGSSSIWFSVVLKHESDVRVVEARHGKDLPKGKKLRLSLGTASKKHATDTAIAMAKEFAEARITGLVRQEEGGPTLGQIFGLYRVEKMPLFTEGRAKFAATHIDLFTEAWGSDFRVANLSQSHVARFVADRRSGVLAPDLQGRTVSGVRDGTVDGDFKWLRSVLNFARRHKVDGGRRFLSVDPLDDLPAWPKEKRSPWPKEKNKRKPVASHERYARTQEHTDAVDPTGRLRCILALARFTGRRESAICGLGTTDVLRDQAAVTQELAGAGMDERIGGHMPHGALRWNAATDKEGFLFIAPLSREARAEIDRYLAKSPRVGDVPLFPGSQNEMKAVRRDVASRWLLKAEKMAELPKLHGGVYHPYRRLWASERKALPSVDVAECGGWKDIDTMMSSYVTSDAATVLRVVENTG